MPRSQKDELTPREKDVLELLAKGKRNKEIAVELIISELTTQNHIHNILSKLGLSNRTQAAIHAKNNDLFE